MSGCRWVGRVVIATVGFVGLVGCGLQVDIESTPNPAIIGRPVEIKVDLLNDEETCDITDITVCIFPFSTLTAEQQQLIDALAEAKANDDIQGFAEANSLPAEFPCNMDVAMQPFAEASMPAEGASCTMPDGNAPISCTVDSLGPGESTSFSVFVTPSEAGMFVNLVNADGVISGAGCTPNPAMDSNNELITVADEPRGVPLLSSVALAILMAILAAAGATAIRRRARRV